MENTTEMLNRYLVSWTNLGKWKYTWTVIANNEAEANGFVISNVSFLNGTDDKTLSNIRYLKVNLLKQNIRGGKNKGIVKCAYCDHFNGKHRHIKLMIL